MGEEVRVEITTTANFEVNLTEGEARAIAMFVGKKKAEFITIISEQFGIGNKIALESLYDKIKAIKELGEQVTQARETIRANAVGQVLVR